MRATTAGGTTLSRRKAKDGAPCEGGAGDGKAWRKEQEDSSEDLDMSDLEKLAADSPDDPEGDLDAPAVAEREGQGGSARENAAAIDGAKNSSADAEKREAGVAASSASANRLSARSRSRDAAPKEDSRVRSREKAPKEDAAVAPKVGGTPSSTLSGRGPPGPVQEIQKADGDAGKSAAGDKRRVRQRATSTSSGSYSYSGQSGKSTRRPRRTRRDRSRGRRERRRRRGRSKGRRRRRSRRRSPKKGSSRQRSLGRQLPAAWRNRNKSPERSRSRGRKCDKDDNRERSRSGSRNTVWRRLECLRPRSPDDRQRHVEEQDREEVKRLEDDLKRQVRGKKRQAAILTALRILEGGYKCPEDLLLAMLENAARAPGPEVFAQTLQLAVVAGGLRLSTEDFARICGILMQREAPVPQIRAFLNCALPKTAEPVPIVPSDLPPEEAARLFDKSIDRELHKPAAAQQQEDEGDEEFEDEDELGSSAPPATVITMRSCRGRPELNGRYILSVQLSTVRPIYEKEGTIESEKIFVQHRQRVGWCITSGLHGEALAVAKQEARSPPCLGWSIVKPDGSKVEDPGGFMQKQVGIRGVAPAPKSASTPASAPAASGTVDPKAAPVIRQAQFCPGCGNKYDPAAVFCEMCGTKKPEVSVHPAAANATSPLAAVAAAAADIERKSKANTDGDRVDARQALERLNLPLLRGKMHQKEKDRGVAEYFGHFVVLLHLEYLADALSVKRRREKASAEQLIKWGWAVAELRLLNTFGKRDGGTSRRNQNPGWDDLGTEMAAFAFPGPVDLDRLRIKRGDSVTVSQSDPAVDRVGEGAVSDVRVGTIVVQLRGQWPKDAQNQVWRVDKSANMTVYERQMQALCALPAALKAQQHTVELLTLTPVGMADRWALEWRKHKLSNKKEQRGQRKKTSGRMSKGVSADGKDSEPDKSSDEASSVERERTRRKLRAIDIAQMDATGVKDELITKAKEAAKSIEGLNESQRNAVEAALTRTCTVVQGPPGTGKTHVSVHILRIWAKVLGLSPVLATSDSNVAVDNICEGLRAKGVRAVRVGRPEKVRGIIEDMTLEAELRREKDKKKAEEEAKKIEQELKEREEREKAEKEVKCPSCDTTVEWGVKFCTSCGTKMPETKPITPPPEPKPQAEPKALEMKGKGKFGKGKPMTDHDIGEAAREAFEDRRKNQREDFELQMKILNNTEVICTTTVAAGAEFLHKFTFQAALVDEVAQATELSTIVPVILRGAKRLALVGDHCQLPPSVLSSEAALRGLSLSVYSRLVDAAGIKPFLLNTQYRSHPKIAEFSSKAFYEGKLASGVTAFARVPPQGFKWPSVSCPVAFINVDAQEEQEGESKMNSTEATLIADIVRNVFRAGELKVADLGVVTPYMAQVRKLRQLLRPALPPGSDMRHFECASVDNFQGREKEMIVFSAVRSNRTGNVGFLADWRRLNVMLTRARRGLVVVGNAETLKHDAIWERWLQFAEDNEVIIWDMPSRLELMRQAYGLESQSHQALYQQTAKVPQPPKVPPPPHVLKGDGKGWGSYGYQHYPQAASGKGKGKGSSEWYGEWSGHHWPGKGGWGDWAAGGWSEGGWWDGSWQSWDGAWDDGQQQEATASMFKPTLPVQQQKGGSSFSGARPAVPKITPPKGTVITAGNMTPKLPPHMEAKGNIAKRPKITPAVAKPKDPALGAGDPPGPDSDAANESGSARRMFVGPTKNLPSVPPKPPAIMPPAKVGGQTASTDEQDLATTPKSGGSKMLQPRMQPPKASTEATASAEPSSSSSSGPRITMARPSTSKRLLARHEKKDEGDPTQADQERAGLGRQMEAEPCESQASASQPTTLEQQLRLKQRELFNKAQQQHDEQQELKMTEEMAEQMAREQQFQQQAEAMRQRQQQELAEDARRRQVVQQAEQARQQQALAQQAAVAAGMQQRAAAIAFAQRAAGAPQQQMALLAAAQSRMAMASLTPVQQIQARHQVLQQKALELQRHALVDPAGAQAQMVVLQQAEAKLKEELAALHAQQV